jgi:hypothetical protein
MCRPRLRHRLYYLQTAATTAAAVGRCKCTKQLNELLSHELGFFVVDD